MSKLDTAYEQLRQLVSQEKQAEAVTTNSGEAAKPESNSESVVAPPVDQNKVKPTEKKKEDGPETTENPTGEGTSLPVPEAAKSASLEDAANALLAIVNQHKQAAEATQNCGTCADPRVEAKSVQTPAINKNKVKATANTPQGPAQVAGAKTAEDLDKIMSYAYGRAMADDVMRTNYKNAYENIKTAARRDFEALLKNAAAIIGQQRQAQHQIELKKQAALNEARQKAAFEQIKRVEQERIQKQAQLDLAYKTKEAQYAQALEEKNRQYAMLHEKAAALLAEQAQRLQQLEASVTEKTAALDTRLQDERDAQKFASFVPAISSAIMDQIRREFSK